VRRSIGLGFSLLTLAATLVALSACTAAPSARPPASEAAATVTPQSAVSSLGSAVESVTISSSGGWSRVRVVLRSAPATAAVDRAAAAVLAAVASGTTTDSPVTASVYAPGLGVPSEESTWGALSYQWCSRDYSRRGDEVMLFRSGAGDPHSPPTKTGYTGYLRGFWKPVDVATLREWTKNGTPPAQTGK
jgi:hypothetical protein